MTAVHDPSALPVDDPTIPAPDPALPQPAPWPTQAPPGDVPPGIPFDAPPTADEDPED